jgi:hypothetical protein
MPPAIGADCKFIPGYLDIMDTSVKAPLKVQRGMPASVAALIEFTENFAFVAFTRKDARFAVYADVIIRTKNDHENVKIRWEFVTMTSISAFPVKAIALLEGNGVTAGTQNRLR